MNRDVVVDYCDCSFLADGEMGVRMINGRYERQEIGLIDKIPYIENMSVLELGACLGAVSVVINKKLKNPENHIAVEANPKLIRYLEHNKNLNNCKFKVENAMISSRSDGVFYSYDKLVAGSAHRRDNREKNKTKHIVDVMSLKELMDKYKISFDVIVLDIEGGELEFLEDMGDTDVKYIMVELHEGQMYRGFDSKCLQLLEHRGMVQVAKNQKSFLYGMAS